MERVDESKVVIITIACNADKGLKPGNLCSEVHSPTEIARVPDLIDRLKKVLEAGIKYSVCVRDQSDVHFIRIGIVQR
jgi:hypothetical protein